MANLSGFVKILDGVVLVRGKARHSRVAVLHFQDGTKVAVREDAPPAESFGRGQFVVLFQDAVNQAVMEFRSGPTLRVLLALPKLLDWRAWRRLDQECLAGELGLHRSQVTTALLKLLGAGYVERRGKRGQYDWRLLPKLGWRGTVRQYHQHVAGLAADKNPGLPLGPAMIAESILWKVLHLK